MDKCSLDAYTDLKDRGKLENDQLSVLNVFRKSSEPLTAREAYALAIADGISIDFNGTRSRITELAGVDGLLEKFDKKYDKVSTKKVNRWRIKQVSRKMVTDFFLCSQA